LLATLYDPANYFRRCRTLLSRLPQRSRSARKVTWLGIRALLRSLARQTFSAYGLHYLRLLAYSVARRPDLFPDAVAFAIRGYHLFIITNEILAADAFSHRLGIARQDWQPRVAAALHTAETGTSLSLERRILRQVERAQRDYQRFSQEAQAAVRQTLGEFAEACSAWVNSLRLARVRVRAN
jgi:hypothetical protein